LTEEQLLFNYPRLWHMAHEGSWDAIREHGLMSARALLDHYAVTGAARDALESARRPESVPLARDGLPGAVIRDQKPMNDVALARCLTDGLRPADWYRLLNSRTFFWLSRRRIWSLLKARAYRNLPQTVLTIDTASIIAAHRHRIWLSPMNSGSTLFNALPRGSATFQRITDFPFDVRRQTRSLHANVVELVIEHSVRDVANHVLAVHEVLGDQIIRQIWRSDNATDTDHP
jgi:hypothetical protein